MAGLQLPPYTWPLLGVSLVSAGLAWYAAKCKATPGALPLSLTALSITVWTAGYALEIASSYPATKVFWAKFQYLGIVTLPVFWFLLAVSRADPGRKIGLDAAFLLLTLPLTTLFLVFTTERHGLVWRKIGLVRLGDSSALAISHGPWFWVHSVYSYALLFAGTVIILWSLARRPGPYRGQTVALTVSVLAPWAGNILYLLGLWPIPHLDPTPFAFSVTVLTLTCGLFRFQLVDLVPIAHSTVQEEMPDGVVVLDLKGRVVEVNPQAAAVLGVSPGEIVGKKAAEVFDAWPRLADLIVDNRPSSIELPLTHGTSQRWYEVRTTPLYALRNRPIGQVMVLHEVTERKQMEEKLRQSEMRAQQQRRSVIISLSAHPAIFSGNVSKAVKILTKSSSMALQVDRVGAWLLSDDGSTLKCIDLYCAATGEHAEGLSLNARKYPGFFGAIRTENCIAAVEARNDPRTAELTADYFEPAGIFSVLAAGIFIEGNLVGVLFHEKQEPREWQPDEEVFAGTIASLIAQALINAERKRMEKEIYHLAFYDPLTGLANRRLLMDRLTQALALSRRTGKHGALLILDLDNFKTLNDTQGHDVGDTLLVQLAERLKANLRASDTVARLGGDEFVILLEDLSEDEPLAAAQAKTVAEKIRAAVAQPFVLSGSSIGEYRITTSIGVSLFRGEDGSPKEVLKRADLALFKAKESGRNAVRLFDTGMQALTDARAELEAHLRRAVERREFEVHLQPIVNARGRVIGAEALLRWRRGTGSLITPDAFIPLAEETGLIVPLGQWVLEEACRQLKAWQGDPFLAELYLSVNVSPVQFRQPDFVESVLSRVEAYGIEGSRLKLEITEHIVLENFEEATTKMRRLRARGIGFCLDDFGTGYSSLAYLKSLPLDQLKIDSSFIRDLPHNLHDAAIVQAIIAIGHRLDIQVIAEGVETEAQKEFLAANGCYGFQGHLFGRPVPPQEFCRAIRQWGPKMRGKQD